MFAFPPNIDSFAPRRAFLEGMEFLQAKTLENSNHNPCCRFAVKTPNCVCRTWWVCPLHGDTHIGTHE